MLGATEPGPGISNWQALLMEFLLTAGLVSTILGTASKAQNLGPISAFGVGAYIILAGLWSSPISGASMNPARSFGPDLVLSSPSVLPISCAVVGEMWAVSRPRREDCRRLWLKTQFSKMGMRRPGKARRGRDFFIPSSAPLLLTHVEST
jgi:hypothetical protein